MRFAFLLLVGLPLLELMLLLKIGGLLGVLPTLALIVTTAALGLSLVRKAGLAVFGRARASLSAGQLPARELLEGVLVACCGALLLAPGLLTDALALCFLTPGIRSLVVKVLRHKLRQGARGASGGFRWSATSGRSRAGSGRPHASGPGMESDQDMERGQGMEARFDEHRKIFVIDGDEGLETPKDRPH